MTYGTDLHGQSGVWQSQHTTYIYENWITSISRCPSMCTVSHRQEKGARMIYLAEHWADYRCSALVFVHSAFVVFARDSVVNMIVRPKLERNWTSLSQKKPYPFIWLQDERREGRRKKRLRQVIGGERPDWGLLHGWTKIQVRYIKRTVTNHPRTARWQTCTVFLAKKAAFSVTKDSEMTVTAVPPTVYDPASIPTSTTSSQSSYRMTSLECRSPSLSGEEVYAPLSLSDSMLYKPSNRTDLPEHFSWVRFPTSRSAMLTSLACLCLSYAKAWALNAVFLRSRPSNVILKSFSVNTTVLRLLILRTRRTIHRSTSTIQNLILFRVCQPS